MAQHQHLTGTVNESQLGQRLDQTLAEMFPDYSRSRIKAWILDGQVRVNGRVTTVPKEKILSGEVVEYKPLSKKSRAGKRKLSR